jgi:hypothetical protein
MWIEVFQKNAFQNIREIYGALMCPIRWRWQPISCVEYAVDLGKGLACKGGIIALIDKNAFLAAVQYRKQGSERSHRSMFLSCRRLPLRTFLR